MQIKVKVDDKKVRRALRNVKKQVKSSSEILDRVGKLEVKKAQNRVRATKKSPDGQNWAPWSYRTLRQRVRQGNVSKGLLNRTGNLLRSFRSKVVRNTLKIFSSVPYAKYLQRGTRRMPARRFLGWDKTSTKDLTKRFSYWIKRGWK